MHGNGTYLCSVRGDPTAAPVAASQIRTVLSPEPPLLAIHLPQGEYATDVTAELLKNTKLVLNHERRHSTHGNGTYQ